MAQLILAASVFEFLFVLPGETGDLTSSLPKLDLTRGTMPGSMSVPLSNAYQG